MKNKTGRIVLMSAAVLVVLLTAGCAIRPEREQKAVRRVPVSWYLYDEVVVNLPANEAFNFRVTRIPDVYTDMVEGTPLALGKHVNCREVAGTQEVSNHYVVTDLIPNRMIYFVSDGSRILYAKPNGEVNENESNTHVYWNFVPLSSNQTRVTLTIVVGLPDRTLKLLGSLFGSKRLWQNHLTEELVNMGLIMEDSA